MFLTSFAKNSLIVIVHAYRLLISPAKIPCCRFVPTCSEYAVDAIRLHGAIKGSWLVLKRLVRCRPFGENGYDPVPSGRSDWI